MKENEISKIIVEAAIEVHRELGGPGLASSNAKPQSRKAAKKPTHFLRTVSTPP